MQRASEQAKRTVAVLSPDYLESRFSREEWTAALADSKLLPVRVREVELIGVLGVQIYIDLAGLPEDEAQARLLEELQRKGRIKPSGKPRFPAAEPRFPGALPEIWNVPPIRNPNFIGREEELVSLQTALKQHHVVALTGLGGIGKSQLAVQLAHRCVSDVDIVWWISAEEPTTLVRDLAALAPRLGLQSDDEPAAAEAVRRHLEQRGRWLLIFDNARDPAVVRSFVPQAQTGSTLITSRSVAWGGVARAESIDRLAQASAAELLVQRAALRSSESAAELAERLGGLPLALEQAGAFLEATHMPVEEYLALFDTRSGELLARGAESGVPTVATVWQLSFQELAAYAPLAAELLTLAAFLAPDNIPRGVFQRVEGLPESVQPLADPLAYADALAALARYSLVNQTADGFSVHRLVQDVTRDRLADDARRHWAAVAAELVNASFSFDRRAPATWSAAGGLLPHALRAAEHARRYAVAPEATSEVLVTAGLYLWRRGEFAQARQRFADALEISEAAFGPNDQRVAVAVNNLGAVLREINDLDGAQAAYERALAIAETNNSDDATIATFVGNIGRILRERGDLAGAKAAHERALKLDEAYHGPDDPEVAIDLNNIGGILHDLNDLDGAQAAYERALEIDRAAYGSSHPSVALRLDNLATVFHERGDPTAARAMFEEALEIQVRVLGSDHPGVARTLNNLAGALKSEGDIDSARTAYEHAISICERMLGADHPSTKIVRANLSSLPDQK